MKTISDVVATLERWLKDGASHRVLDGNERRQYVEWDRTAVEQTVLVPLKDAVAKMTAVGSIAAELERDTGDPAVGITTPRQVYVRQIAEEYRKAIAFVAMVLGEADPFEEEQKRAQEMYWRCETDGLIRAATVLCPGCADATSLAFGGTIPPVGRDGKWIHADTGDRECKVSELWNFMMLRNLGAERRKVDDAEADLRHAQHLLKEAAQKYRPKTGVKR